MRAWNLAGGSPWRGQQPAHRQLEHAVGGLAVEHPVGQRGAERRDAVAAPAGVDVDRPAEVVGPGQRLQQDVADGGVHRGRVDGAEVAEEPQDVRGADPGPHHGGEVAAIAGPVHDDAVEARLPVAHREDDVDGVVVRAGHAPEVGRAAVRRHRPPPGGEHGGGDALLPGLGHAREAGDAGMERDEPPVGDRPVPGRARRHRRLPGQRVERDQPVVGGRPLGNGVHVHARPVGRHRRRNGKRTPYLGPVVFRFRDAGRPGTDPAQMGARRR